MQKNKKWFFIFAAVFSILFSQMAFAANDVKVFFKGSEIFFDVPPQIINGRTMVPLRTTIETITGQPMQWDAATKTVTFSANGHTNRHTIGEKVVYADGVPMNFDSPSLILDSRTLVPVRMIAETSGCTVDWDAADKFVLITPPASAQPQPQPSTQPMIDSLSASRTTLNSGETVDFTIRTNSAANYVWASFSSGTLQASYKSTDTAGYKTWTVTVKPASSGNITVYANSDQSSSGAATRTQYINVGGGVSIYSVGPNKTTINQGDSVTFSIRTSLPVNNVWVEYDNTSVNASFVRQENSSEESWTVTFNPRDTQNVRVYANTSRTTSGAASDTQRITVNTSTNVSILSASASKTTVSPGETVTITAKTTSAAGYVWLNTGSDGAAFSGGSQDSSGNKTWTVSYRPSESGSVTVSARRTQSQSYDDDTRSISITVKNEEEAAILTSYTESDEYYAGDMIAVTCVAGRNITKVVFEINGKKQTVTNYNGNTEREFYATLTAPARGGLYRINIEASTASGTKAYDSCDVYITGDTSGQ